LKVNDDGHFSELSSKTQKRKNAKTLLLGFDWLVVTVETIF